MSQCRVCNSPDFTLDRVSGEMTCSSCGSSNYIGSPSTYSMPTPESIALERFKSERDTSMDNAIFDKGN